MILFQSTVQRSIELGDTAAIRIKCRKICYRQEKKFEKVKLRISTETT